MLLGSTVATIGQAARQGGELDRGEDRRVCALVPRLTAEPVVRAGAGAVFPARGASGPCPGHRHLPGATLRYGIPLLDAAHRVARREPSIEVLGARLLGAVAYPSMYLQGIASPVGPVLESVPCRGAPGIDGGASSGAWFPRLPESMHLDEIRFLVDSNLVGLTP